MLNENELKRIALLYKRQVILLSTLVLLLASYGGVVAWFLINGF